MLPYTSPLQCQGGRLLPIQEEHRDIEIIPELDCHDQGLGEQDRLTDRKNDLHKHTEIGAAVESRGLFERRRDRHEKLLEDQT